MCSIDQIYENTGAFFNSAMTSEEKKLLSRLRRVAKVAHNNWMPEHYKLLEAWSPDIFENDMLYIT
jgi:hypothetical protein